MHKKYDRELAEKIVQLINETCSAKGAASQWVVDKRHDESLTEDIIRLIRETCSSKGSGPNGDIWRPGDERPISEQLGRMLGFPPGGVNVYPGERCDQCHEFAFFWGIEDFTHFFDGYKRRRIKFPDYKKALKNLKEHMLEKCPNTKVAIVISDSYRDRYIQEYATVLDTIRQQGRQVLFIMINKVGAGIDVTPLTL